MSAAIAFYVGELGFSLAFQDVPASLYAGVRRDVVGLHLQWRDAAEWAREFASFDPDQNGLTCCPNT